MNGKSSIDDSIIEKLLHQSYIYESLELENNSTKISLNDESLPKYAIIVSHINPMYLVLLGVFFLVLTLYYIDESRSSTYNTLTTVGTIVTITAFIITIRGFYSLKVEKHNAESELKKRKNINEKLELTIKIQKIVWSIDNILSASSFSDKDSTLNNLIFLFKRNFGNNLLHPICSFTWY